MSRRRPIAFEELGAALVEPLTRALKQALLDVFTEEDKPGKANRPIARGEVVSEDRAARALPIRRSDAVAWLREEGLVTVMRGRRVVVWDRVLGRLETEPPERAPRRRPSPGPPPLAKPGRIFG